MPALMSSAVASAQSITNGTFAPTGQSTGVWGSEANGGAGYTTVNWTTGQQYAYDPSNVLGWSFVGGAGIQQNGSAWGFTNDPSGAPQTAFLQDYDGSIDVPRADPSTITQAVSGLTPGKTYYLTFYLEQRGSYGQAPVDVLVGVNGVQYEAIVATDTPTSSTTWQLYTVPFVAGPYTPWIPEEITFAAYDPTAPGIYDNDTGIADVALSTSAPLFGSPITAVTVAEGGPALLYLLLAGSACFGAMFLTSRNRSAILATA
jgi:hypothetical protein